MRKKTSAQKAVRKRSFAARTSKETERRLEEDE